MLRSFLLCQLACLSVALGQTLPFRQEDPIPLKVEQMFKKGLAFLAKSQKPDGSWGDSVGDEPGVVGLVVMAYLAHGEDPNYGPHSGTIKKALDFILEGQRADNGYMGSSMYSHGFATLALAESYGVVNDDRLAGALQKAVDLIVSSQARNPRGAWRYSPDSQDADSTVTGCQLVALYAARNAGIPVPNEAFEKGHRYMEQCRAQSGGYGYTSPHRTNPTLTSIGSLCLSLANEDDTPKFRQTTEFLKGKLNYRDTHYPYYFEYYMSQALFHADEAVWENWNVNNIRYLATLQAPDGSFIGNRGPTFSTAGALLSLALNYRYLPIYER